MGREPGVEWHHSTGGSSVLKRLMLIAAVLAVVGSGSAAAAPPVELSYACALKAGGLMRYVASPTQCSSKLENAVTIKPGPVNACVLPGGLVYRTLGTCSPRSQPLTLPASSDVYFCALKILGTLRSVSSPTQCSKLESAVVVTPSSPAIPSASAATVCLPGGPVIRVTLSNGNQAGGESVTFTLASAASGSNPAFNQQATVLADSSTSVDVPVDENDTRTVTVDAPGLPTQTFTLTGNCQANAEPTASAQVVCVTGGPVIRVTLENGAPVPGESVTFQTSSAGTPAFTTRNDTIAAGGANVVINVPVTENDTRTVEVSAPGLPPSQSQFTLTGNCLADAQPAASAQVVCVSGSPFIRVTLENLTAAGGESVTFQTSSAGTPAFTTRNDTIAAGGADVIINVPVTENDTRTVEVSAPGLPPSQSQFTLTGNCVADP